MTIKEKIALGIEQGLITYENSTIKFGRYAIGGISADSMEELISRIESCCYRQDFGGMEFIQNIQ